METKDIEMNIIYWLFKKSKEQGLTKEEKNELNHLCDKYPSESFKIFNLVDGFFESEKQ